MSTPEPVTIYNFSTTYPKVSGNNTLFLLQHPSNYHSTLFYYNNPNFHSISTFLRQPHNLPSTIDPFSIIAKPIVVPHKTHSWGSAWSKIFLKALTFFSKSTANPSKAGSAGRVRMSFQDRTDSHLGAGLGNSSGITVPPAISQRHSNCSQRAMSISLDSTRDAAMILHFGNLYFMVSD